MSKTNMTDFQRTRSKVWFPNLDDDDDDMHHSWRRQPSSSPESRRVSTGSPSNGSHKSQDSGFSDSESSTTTTSPSGSSSSSKGGLSSVNLHQTNEFTDVLPDGVLPEVPVARVADQPCGSQPQPPEHCDCFLPACELSRRFRSYELVSGGGGGGTTTVAELTAAEFLPSPFKPTKKHTELLRTPNRTCFIVDELPKSNATLSSTPGSVKSFDGHFDRSENVTVVENVQQPDNSDGDNESIIDPPTPFVDRLNDDVSFSESDRPETPPEHTSTPKSTKDRCCTPRLHYRKDLQLRKPKNLQTDLNG